MADIKLTDEMLNGVISGAILQMLTPEVRTQLIGDAVKSLLEESSDRWGSKSKIQEAFEHAAREVCHTVAREMLLDDPKVKAEMAAMLTAAWETMIQDRNAVINKLAHTLAKAFDPSER